VRAADGSGELVIPSYELFTSTEVLGRLAMEKMLAGLSTRRYPIGLEPVGQQITENASATSKSAVSRRFVAMTETALAPLLSKDLSGLDVVALMIDGVHFAESCCVVALGIGIDDETERLGYPISRAALANYESGRKKGLDLTEMMIIALALGVPPAVLLFPELPDGAVEVAPGVVTTSWDAVTWFSGEEPPPDLDEELGTSNATSREYKLVNAIREYGALLPRLGELQEMIINYVRDGGGPGQPRPHPRDATMLGLRARMEALRDESKSLDAVILENGGVFDGD